MASKFRLMETENNCRTESCQEQNLSNEGQIQSRDSARLPPPMPRRLTAKDVLARKMREAGGITPPEISRRAAAKGYSVSPTAIKEILKGNTTNPGLVTLEAVAAGMDLSPIEFIAEMLGDRTEDVNFKASRFAVAAELFKLLTPTQQLKADPHIEGLLFQLQRIRSQR